MKAEDVYDLVPIAVGKGELSREEFIEDPSIDAGDIVVPALKVLQGQSPEVLNDQKPAGSFFDSMSQKVLGKKIKALVAFHHKTRFKGANPQGTQMCTSRDMVTGSVYGECAECEYANWREEPSGKRSPPWCSVNQTFVILTTSGPLAVRFRKRAENYARMFLTQVVTMQRNYWAHPVELSVKTEAGKDAGGNPTTYFAPTIRWLLEEDVPEALRASARKVHDGLAQAAAVGRFDTAGDDDAGE